MQKIYKGQTGLKIIVETGALDSGIDLTGATCELVVKKPDGTIVTLTATVENSSQFVYTTENGLILNLTGRYYLQSKVTKSGFEALGNTAVLTVSDNFK